MNSSQKALVLILLLAFQTASICFAQDQHQISAEYPSTQYSDYYYEHASKPISINGIDRQGIQSLLSSPAAGAVQFGALIILGGAAILTGIQAANTNRDLGTLRSRFASVCQAVATAGALDGGDGWCVEDCDEPSVPSVPTVDPVAQEALNRANLVIVALAQVDSSLCKF